MYKILIVEDDLAMAQAIQKEMEMWGNEARYVKDFQNVLAEFTDYDPHLVLMDITLPFFNGYHWCSEIRRISNVPIIFISSAADNMNIIMAVNMGKGAGCSQEDVRSGREDTGAGAQGRNSESL